VTAPTATATDHPPVTTDHSIQAATTEIAELLHLIDAELARRTATGRALLSNAALRLRAQSGHEEHRAAARGAILERIRSGLPLIEFEERNVHARLKYVKSENMGAALVAEIGYVVRDMNRALDVAGLPLQLLDVAFEGLPEPDGALSPAEQAEKLAEHDARLSSLWRTVESKSRAREAEIGAAVDRDPRMPVAFLVEGIADRATLLEKWEAHLRELDGATDRHSGALDAALRELQHARAGCGRFDGRLDDESRDRLTREKESIKVLEQRVERLQGLQQRASVRAGAVRTVVKALIEYGGESTPTWGAPVGLASVSEEIAPRPARGS
jgi:hypothetical protein